VRFISIIISIFVSLKKESMINVELRKGSECGGCENKYPYVGKSISSDAVVYFVGNNRGIMLKNRKDNPNPHRAFIEFDFWNEGAFSRLPSTTEVVLRNA